jgi:hypothetical protein
MSDTLVVSTRKGLFTVSRKRGAWAISAVNFLGDNVSVTLADHRDGRRYAALDLGHFGVKLHRSTARQRPAGRRLPPRRIQPNRKATKRPICGAGPWIGARLAFGRSSPGAPTSQVSFGVERFRAVFSAQAITGRAGR